MVGKDKYGIRKQQGTKEMGLGTAVSGKFWLEDKGLVLMAKVFIGYGAMASLAGIFPLMPKL